MHLYSCQQKINPKKESKEALEIVADTLIFAINLFFNGSEVDFLFLLQILPLSGLYITIIDFRSCGQFLPRGTTNDEYIIHWPNKGS